MRRHDQANPYVATVKTVAHDCDLAVLTVDDPAFTKGMKPLEFGDLPRSGSRVLTFGFPLGGQEVSSTAGIVSRVESRGYVHTGVDSHLVVQTDAAINPGNSGGPVVQDGRVVGVAFQGYPGFDNMGFFIPVPVVRHFLGDAADGAYDGFPDSGLSVLPLLSPAYRRERGLPEGRSGVVVDLVAPGSTADGVLQKGDVLLAVDGQAVANDGTVQGRRRPRHLRARLRHEAGGRAPAPLLLARRRKEQSRVATSRRLVRLDNQRNRYGVAPRYVVYAGLVFMPLDRELMKVFGRGWAGSADRNLIWHHLYREAEQPATVDREVVVLTRVMRHPVNSQMTFPGPSAVARINGREIKGLADVLPALAGGERPLPDHRARGGRRFRGPGSRAGGSRARGDLEAVWDRERQEPLAGRARPALSARCPASRAGPGRPRPRVKARAGGGHRAHHGPGVELEDALVEAEPLDAHGHRPRGARAPRSSWPRPPIGNHLLLEAQKQGEDLRTPARLAALRPRGPARPPRRRRPGLLDGASSRCPWPRRWRRRAR